MTFKHKLSKRLALSWRYVIPALVLAGCEAGSQLLTAPSDGSRLSTVVIAPAATATDYQDTLRFRAFGRTAAGDSVALPVTWAATGGKITMDGLFTSDTIPGSFQVKATADSVTGSAQVLVGISGTVSESLASATRPSTVTDLAVSAVGDTAVTLTFTQVDDGTGQPASYDIRFAPTPINWGSAPSVTRGTCATPLAGTAIGAKLSCTVLGLAPQTAYDFRLVAFRGTLNVDAVFGKLSNIASATTAATATVTNPGTVTDLAVAGTTDSSATLSFTEVSDGAGQPASYDIRYTAGTISWGAATTVSQGTCAAPVSGVQIGAKLTCTILGLAAATAYQFQAVAFRGTLNVNAVFGGLSNVASATTAAVDPAVASVTVSPSSASGTVGQSAQFTATVKDASGNVLTGQAIAWSSSNAAVVKVDSTGYATATGAGSATITATSGGKNGQAAVSVAGTTSQSTVASVTVSPSTASAVVGQTGTFTATAKDASGNVLTGVTFAWSSNDTAVVKIDATGFATATGPGSATITASTGGVSGTASVSITGSTSTGQPASVTVSPSSVSLIVGGIQQLTATVYDASGNVLSGQTITWSSSNALVASVGSTGLATALTLGSTTITASDGGVSGTAPLTVGASSPPPSGSWPDEPSGFTTLSDYGFTDSIPIAGNNLIPLGTSGWGVEWNPVGNGSQTFDSGAPFSPPDEYQVEYPIGFAESSAPSTLEYDFSTRTPEFYWGFWWKPSNPFQSHSSGVNKIAFIFTPEQSSSTGMDLLYFDLVPNPWRILCQNDLYLGGGPTAGALMQGNVATTTVALGQWHRIEIYVKYSTGSNADGIVKWWVDGQLNGSYSNLKMVQDGGFDHIQFSPTYGGAGTGETKTENDFFWFDHTHVSVP